MEKDPFVSRDSQENEVASETMKVSVVAPRMLQMNIPATLMSSLVETLGNFMTCTSGVREATDGFFVRVNNTTGYPM